LRLQSRDLSPSGQDTPAKAASAFDN
jgi:hypothetical protein